MKIVLPRLTERGRRTTAHLLAITGWWGALILTFLDLVVVNTDGNPGSGSKAARILGILIVLLLGVGIAASGARSRMRLADTVTGAFQVGMAVAEEPRRTCVMETDMAGSIRWVENADVIGWTRDALLGHQLRDLLPDRLRAVHDANVLQLVESGSGREIGPTITLSVRAQDGREITAQKQLSRLGDRFIATVTALPVKDYQSNGHRAASLSGTEPITAAHK